MRISVILPVYNEEVYIEACLKSIVDQKVKIWEIIVVDDGSTDNSKEVINNSKKKYKISNLKLLFQKHQGPARARNRAARFASGKILISLDADMVYDKYYIARLIKPIIRENEIAVTTSGERVANLDNRLARFWDKVTFDNHGKRVMPYTSDRDETFRAILTKYFRKVHGFDSFGVSDDVSVLIKLKKTAKSINNAFCYHYNPATLFEVFYSARWMGRDKNNHQKYFKFFIFSPIWSFVKALIWSFILKDWYFIPFRLVFDFGYLMGLIDINFKSIHYK